MTRQGTVYIRCATCGGKLRTKPVTPNGPRIRYDFTTTYQQWSEGTPVVHEECGTPRRVISFDLSGKVYDNQRLTMVGVEHD